MNTWQWFPAKYITPETYINDFGELASKPVIVWDGVKQFFATYMVDEENDIRRWNTCCSEGWDVTERVLYWIQPPDDPLFQR